MNRRIGKLLVTLGLVATALALSAAPALAVPELDVTLERDLGPGEVFDTVYHSDERVDFTVGVRNTATEAPPAVGDTLRCIGEPPERSWSGNPAPTFTYQWTRNGEPIAGATSTTYTATSADEGAALQCVVTGANVVDVQDPPESVTATSAVASHPLHIPPAPSTPPPTRAHDGTSAWNPPISGSGATGTRTCTPPPFTTGSAHADLTSGSTVLETVTTSRGFATVEEGPSTVSEVTNVRISAYGVPVRVGQTVTLAHHHVDDPPPFTEPDTEIIAVDEANNTITISPPADVPAGIPTSNVRLAAGSQPLEVGEEIFGEGIPAGTKIAAIDGQEVTLDAPATITKSDVVISTASTATWSFQWLRNGEPIAGATDREYIPGPDDENVVLQCRVVGTTGTGEAPDGGALVGISENSFTGVLANSSQSLPEPPPSFSNQFPFVATPNYASGLRLDVELPAGQQTFAFEISARDWTCEALPPSGTEPATVQCRLEKPLAPGEEARPVDVITALGADAPDLAVVRATAVADGGAATASDELTFEIQPAKLFGLETFTAALLDRAGEEHVQAGRHPFRAESELALTSKRTLVEGGGGLNTEEPIEQLKRVIVEVPPGVTGNPLAAPELCPDLRAVSFSECPPASRVGRIDLVLTGANTDNTSIFAVEPEFGSPAQFAFKEPNPFTANVFVLDARLRPEDGYAVNLELAPAPEVRFLGSTVDLCSFGARSTSEGGGCREAGEAGAFPKPLLTAPTRCGVPLETRVRVNSWDDPSFVEGSFPNAPMTGCHEVPFEPTSDLRPTSGEADSPTGFEVELSLPSEGLEDPEGISQSHLRKAEVTLPEGMAVNPSAAQGLGACSEDEIKLGTNQPISCPGSSKIGTAEIETPILEDTLEGAVYVAEQGAVDGSLLGFYLVFDSPENGILVKQAAKVTPDPETGQLVVTVAESPQQPFSSVKLSFPGGDRATLLTPPKCGTYEIVNELTPWSGGPPVTEISKFRVSSGPGGGPCPNDALLPALHSGVTSPLAGQPSPFVMRLHRPDGTDRFKAISIRPPEGLIAKLKGIPYCTEAQIGLARSRSEPGTGQDEIDRPSCPAASQIGRVIVGAGAGPDPFYTTTPRAYLAGPYKGAPLSIVVIAPAVAGPLDLGNAVVRNAVHINPRTAKISVMSDPIPHILHGLLLDVRDVRVLVDRPDFTRNPTDCSPKRMGADVRGLIETAIAQPSNHFQVGNCAALGFKPRTGIQLFGKTNRGAYQGVRAVVRPRLGDANISRTTVRFPRSAFIAQEHLRNVCTRVQYAADVCPKGSIYGKAVAWSPLLDLPLRGNVYLRSSDNELPDLVADLRGPAHQPIRVEVAVRNDAVKGALRNTVQAVPDAPVSYFRLQIFGGNKGLIVNSRNICRGRNQARVAMGAHNGRRSVQRVNVFNRRCAKQRKARRKAKRRAARKAAAKHNRPAAAARSSRAG